MAAAFKNGIPVYFRSELFTSRKYEKLPNIVIHACKILQKNEIVENVWPANSALFIYVFAQCIETVQ